MEQIGISYYYKKIYRAVLTGVGKGANQTFAQATKIWGPPKKKVKNYQP